MKLPRKHSLLVLLLFLLLFNSAHIIGHATDDHNHDASCAVYVLEELFVAHDVPTQLLLLTLFSLFIPLDSLVSQRSKRSINNYQERAPPHAILL